MGTLFIAWFYRSDHGQQHLSYLCVRRKGVLLLSEMLVREVPKQEAPVVMEEIHVSSSQLSQDLAQLGDTSHSLTCFMHSVCCSRYETCLILLGSKSTVLVHSWTVLCSPVRTTTPTVETRAQLQG